jgi:hypothetical protein
MPVKMARNEEQASDDAHNAARLRRKAPQGRVNREARDDAKVIQKAIERPRKVLPTAKPE